MYLNPIFERQKKKNYQLKSIPSLNPKTTNRSSKQFSITNVIVSHSSTFELKKKGGGGGHSSQFIKSIFTDQLKAR